jgi:MFS family permease
MHSYLDLLRRNRHYRNLWIARVISNLGDWFNLLASAALVAQITNSGAAISYLFLARMLPVFFVTPFAGVLADRISRRNIMIAADVLRAVTVLGFLLVDSPDELWLFYGLTILQFALSALYNPAHSAVIPNIVEPNDLVTANALDGFTWSVMLAIGALLGGIASSLFGVTAAFVIDAASFLLSAYFVMRVTLVYVDVRTSARQGGFLDFVDGMRYLRVRPILLGLALVKAAAAIVWGIVNVLEVPLAEQVYPLNGSGTLTLGLIYMTVGVGTGVGPLLMRRWFGDDYGRVLWAIGASFVLLTVGVLAIALASGLGWALIGVLLRSLGSGSVWVFSSVLLQRLTQDAFRGRVFAFDFTAFTLTQSIGVIWAGYAQDQLGMSVQQGLLSAAAVSLAVTVMWFGFQGIAMRVQPALKEGVA